ncbi:MAG: sulfatase-like hydrolase/transferase [Phycisphaeraceae bacterium]|nr:sulfatase-like hydrolase/transferase [Phycisphaeraceae bacterium]
MQRPNIVLIHSDQHRFDCVGVNGHALVKTPHMDRMASEGINFTHAFTPTAICSPARASLMTGLWPSQHGCRSIPGTELYQPADPHLVTFSTLLHNAGYRLGWIGRYHGEVVGEPTRHGFDQYTSDHGYAAWRAMQGIPELADTGGYLGFFGATDIHIRPDQSAVAWSADQAIRWLDDAAAARKPFFLRWDVVEPHLPCLPPEPYASMYRPASIEPWRSFPDTLDSKPYIQTQQRRTWRVENWGWHDWAPVVARYLGVISLLDAQVGRLLTRLDELRIADNTLIIYTTDHGDLCGGHGMMDKHFVMYDDVMRVPLIARWPSRLEAGQTNDNFVIHELDLAATFCDAAGLEIPHSYEGMSLISSARDKTAARRDVFGQWHGAQLGLYTQRMVRDRRWKYVWNCTAEDELYDLQKDPGELINIAGQAEHRAQLIRLRQRLIEWMESIGDPMCNPWTRGWLTETEPRADKL